MDQKKSIFGNSMWMISERLLQAAISIVVSAITRRYLGVDNNGLLAFGSACVSVFLTLSSLGLEFVLIKELIESRRMREIYWAPAWLCVWLPVCSQYLLYRLSSLRSRITVRFTW